MNLDNNLIFLHIPKNGGTTFDTILDKNNLKENTYNIQPIGVDELNVHHFVDLPISEREKIKLLKGHMVYGLHKHLVGDTDYISFLRKPEDRIISYYYYVLAMPSHRLHKRVKNEKMSLYDFVVNIDEFDIHNAQIGVLSGIVDTEEIMLEKAIYNIENHFSFIGLVERFDESLILFKKKHPLKRLYYKSLNRTKKRIGLNEIDSKTKDAIAERNKSDNILYNAVEKQFNQEISEISTMKTELFKLKMFNNLFELYSYIFSDNFRLKVKNTILNSN
jgi:hypothetical protein